MKTWHYVAIGVLAYFAAKLGKSAINNWFGVTSI